VIKKLKDHPHNRWGFCAIFDTCTTQVEPGLKSGPNFVTSIQTTYYPRLLAPFFPVTSPSQGLSFGEHFVIFSVLTWYIGSRFTPVINNGIKDQTGLDLDFVILGLVSLLP
jgi:hypothetical protein